MSTNTQLRAALTTTKIQNADALSETEGLCSMCFLSFWEEQETSFPHF